MKFKVGDTVKILDGSNINCYIGGWASGMRGYVGETRTIVHVDPDGTCNLEGTPYVWDPRGLKLVKEKSRKPIVIYRKGQEVIAVDKATGKRGIARCCPEDTFDFQTGAKIAFVRLMEEKESKKRLYNGKVVCVKAINPFFTNGKIYEFKNGRAIDDDGDQFPIITPIETLRQLNEIMWSDFIEVVE